MDIKAQLQQLYKQYESDLATYAWASETDRWAELIFCLLHQCSRQEPETIRSALAALQSLSLTDVGKMLHLDNVSHENRIVFAYILKQYGFSSEDVELTCSLLAQVAKAVQHNYGGNIQRYLRRHGELMCDELVSMFGSTALDKPRISHAISHWLQNVLSMPISLKNDAVVEFCQRNSVSPQDLWHAADELDLNIALVDDLLEIDQRTREMTSETPDREEGGS